MIAVILALFVRTWVVQAFRFRRVRWSQPADRRSPAGQQVRVWSEPSRSAGACRSRTFAAAHRRVQIPGGARSRLHQARDRAAGETIELRNKKIYINGKPLDEPYAHFLTPPSGEFQEVTSVDVREDYPARSVPPDSVLRDGRQPRQLAGQPVLGLLAARTTSRARRCSSTGRTSQAARTISTRGSPHRRSASLRSSSTFSPRRAGSACFTEIR